MKYIFAIVLLFGVVVYGADPVRWGHHNREITLSGGVKIMISYPGAPNEKIVRTPASDLAVLREAVVVLESIVKDREKNRK